MIDKRFYSTAHDDARQSFAPVCDCNSGHSPNCPSCVSNRNTISWQNRSVMQRRHGSLLTSHYFKFHVFHFCNFILIFAGCFYCQLVWWYMIVYQKRYTNSNFIPRIADKPISFELSLGNAGNSLDGQLTTVCNDAHLFQNFHNVKMLKFSQSKLSN